MGISVDEVHNVFANKLLKDYDALSNQKHTLEEDSAAWGKIEGTLGKIAKTDLPTVLKLYDERLAKQQASGAAEGEILATVGKRLEVEIQIAEQTGKSATSQIIGLEHIRQQQQALYDSTHLLGDTVVSVEKDIEKGWNLVGDAMVDDILTAKNFGKSMEDVGKQVLKMVMTDLVQGAFKELKNSIIGVGGAIKDVKTNWDAFSKAVSDAVGGGKSAVDGVKDATGAVKSTAGGGGGALGMVDAIAGVGSLISNIISNVQFSHMNDSLKVIVNHTLVAANELMVAVQFDVRSRRRDLARYARWVSGSRGPDRQRHGASCRRCRTDPRSLQRRHG
jgi:hypothetical protein